MPVYRTTPDVSLDDLIHHLEWIGEAVISTQHVGDEWVVVTQPLVPRVRNRTINVDTSGLKETR